MSPRRTSRAGREAWAVQERRRRVTQFRVAELAVVLALEGDCAVPGSGWDVAEQGHVGARSDAEAAAAAAPAMALCGECAVLEVCRLWATLDRYTGLAAGRSWVRGREYDPSTTINNSRAA